MKDDPPQGWKRYKATGKIIYLAEHDPKFRKQAREIVARGRGRVKKIIEPTMAKVEKAETNTKKSTS